MTNNPAFVIRGDVRLVIFERRSWSCGVDRALRSGFLGLRKWCGRLGRLLGRFGWFRSGLLRRRGRGHDFSGSCLFRQGSSGRCDFDRVLGGRVECLRYIGSRLQSLLPDSSPRGIKRDEERSSVLPSQPRRGSLLRYCISAGDKMRSMEGPYSSR